MTKGSTAMDSSSTCCAGAAQQLSVLRKVSGHVAFEMQAVPAQVKYPRQYYRRYAADAESNQHGLHDPLFHLEVVEQQISDLGYAPGHNQVGDPDLYQATAFQFRYKAHVIELTGVPPQSPLPMWPARQIARKVWPSSDLHGQNAWYAICHCWQSSWLAFLLDRSG